jgi:hypothetical protein
MQETKRQSDAGRAVEGRRAGKGNQSKQVQGKRRAALAGFTPSAVARHLMNGPPGKDRAWA